MSAPRKVLHLPKVRMLSRGRLPSGVRITNVKSIRPPNADDLKKQEEEKLRAQLQKEIVSRSRTCEYAGYECWTPVVAGRRHCAAHVLCEPAAPYVQCSHEYGSGDRCAHPAPQRDHRDARDPLCFEHARAALLARQRSAAPPPPVVSTETLLNQLQHYVKAERPRTTSCASSVSVVSDPAEPDQVSPVAVDPFKQMDAPAINAAHSLSILECCSGSSSEGESVTLGPDGNCRHQTLASDTEDAPVESTPLWRAGVFTAEEAVSETKQALRSLQCAYIKQMSRLKVLLQTARLQYLSSLKQEKEQYCSINSQARSGPLSVRERRQLRKLKAYAGYHKKHGVDAVLARKLHHKRAKGNDAGSSRPVPSLARCTFSEGGVRCALHSLPASKHCLKHVLHEPHQVLFSACGDLRGAAPCREPVASLPMPTRACRYHTDPPAYTVFTLKKEDSGSDTDTDTAVTDCSMTSEHPADTRERVDHSLVTMDPSLETMDHTLDTMDHALETMDPTLETMDPTLETMDPTLETMDPTLETMDPTLETMDPTLDTMDSSLETLDTLERYS